MSQRCPVRIASAVLLAIGLTLETEASEYRFTISGTFTQQNLASPGPSVTVGTPFSASFYYQLPGTTVAQDANIGWYFFNDSQHEGSATLGNLTYNFESGIIVIGHNAPHYNWFALQSDGDGLAFKVDLGTTDLSLLSDTATIPSSLTLTDFDHARRFEVMRVNEIGIVGEIESLTVTVVPEPTALSLIPCGAGLMFALRTSRSIKPKRS